MNLRKITLVGKSALLSAGALVVAGLVLSIPHFSGATAAIYKLAAVERGAVVSTVSATGTINPITTIVVGSQLSGQIVEISADYNDEVAAGQILARLNSDQ